MDKQRAGGRASGIGLLVSLLLAGAATGQSSSTPSGARSSTTPAAAVPPISIASERQALLGDGRVLALRANGRMVVLLDERRKPIRSWSLSQQRLSASVTVVPSGQVLIWGGRDERNRLSANGLWFDPALDTLSPANLPIAARSAHTTTVLSDGRLLLVGGQTSGSAIEVLDLRHDRVAHLTSSPDGLRSGHRAFLETDGRVHLLGGRDGWQRRATDLWFDPVKMQLSPEQGPAPTPDIALAASTPSQGAQDVDATAPLALRFTQRLRVTDLNPSSVTLIGPGGLTSAKIVAAENGRLLFVTPNQELFPASKYSLLVDGVRSAAGRPLPLVAIDFQTAALPATTPSPSSVQNTSGTSVGFASQPDPQRECRQGRYALPCRATSRLQDGVWTPGRDNTDGRWRIARPQPELMNTTLMARVTEALGFTTLTGQVLRVDEIPVANVEVSIGGNATRTDANGRFMLYEVPAGRQEVYVDGSTANGKGLEYGQFVVGVDVAKGKLTQLPYAMYLPRITARDKIPIPSPLTRDLIMRHPDIPGLMVQIPAGTVMRDRKGRIVRELAIVPTPVNRAPYPLLVNAPGYFTLEPGGAVVQGLTPEAAKGIRVFYPNYDGYKAGTQANFWIYDPADGWRVYGKGRVTSDGRMFSPEAGVALHETMGGMYSIDQNDPPSEVDKPECNEGCGSAQTGEGANAGDPIDLKTGQFSYSETDVVIPDIVPIRFGRSYRPTDISTRSFGLATASSYDIKLGIPDDNHINVVVPSGVAITFDRTSGSGVTGTWRQTGSVTAYNGATLQSGDGHGNYGYLLTFVDGSRTFFYEFAPNYPLWQEDRFGNRTTFTYDAGLLVKVTSPSGRYIAIEHDANNRVSYVHDMIGNTWGYTYNGHGQLEYVTYPDLTNKHYEYVYEVMPDYACPVGDFFTSRCSYYDKMDGLGKTLIQHAIKRIFNRRGIKILENDFEDVGIPDWIGPVITQTLPDGTFYSIDYHHVEPTGEYGTLVTNPDTSQRLVTYQSGWRYPQTDTIGYGTPLAQKVTFERGSYQQVTARIDAMSRRTEYLYDDTGHITQITLLAGTADAKTINADYYPSGDLKSVTDIGERTTTFNYVDGCLSEIIDPILRHTYIQCNTSGQPETVSDPLGHTTNLYYIGYDLFAITDPIGRSVQFRYDVQGRPIAMQDDQGNAVQREYDAENRIKKITDATRNVTEIDYFPDGRVKDVLLPNTNGITYDYNDVTGLQTRTDSLGKTESWIVDSMGRVKTYTDRALQQTSYIYDARGHIQTITYPDLSTATPTYDNGNRLRTLVDSVAGTLSWDFNDLDQLTQTTSAQGSVSYDYDTAGRRWHMTPASQSTIEYRYDDGDRLRKILQGSQVYEFDYDDGDRLTQTTLPNGIKAGYAYNDADQVTGIAWLKPDGSALHDLGYGYDSVGQQIAQTGSLAPQNLPAASTGLNLFNDNNQQTRFNGTAMSYDDNGNLKSDGTRTYVWNTRGQLTQVKQGSTVIASYAYDAIGRRSSRTEGGATTSYLYDGLNPVQETIGSTINPILTGLGVDQRYAQGSGATRRFYLTDALGSTRLMTNITGAVVQRYDYDPYGNTSSTGSVANNYRYTGREQDANGLYYYRARYYSAAMGRFISEDPIGLAGGLNGYAYVEGDPISYIDPLGLAEYPAIILELGGGGGPIGNLGGNGGLIIALDPCDQNGLLRTFGYGGGNVGLGIPANAYGAIEIAVIKADNLNEITGWGWYFGGALASPAGGGIAGTYAAPFFWQSANYRIKSFGYAWGGAANGGVGVSYTKALDSISIGSLPAAQLKALQTAMSKVKAACGCGT